MAKPKLPLTEVVKSGDLRKSLEAIRDHLAEQLQLVVGRDVAPIAKELKAVIAEIDRLPGGEEVSPVDRLSARRKDRLASTKGR